MLDSFEYMQGDKKDKDIVAYRLVAPNAKDVFFLTVCIFPEKKMNLRTTPDQQLPTNNGLANRDLWHWCLVWKWEQLSYDTPLASKLTARQAKDLKTIEQRLTDFLEVKKSPIKSKLMPLTRHLKRAEYPPDRQQVRDLREHLL